MNIDIESTGLLSLVLQDSPKDRQFILCVLARSNPAPTRIPFNPSTDYPTFYAYSNSRIPLYLMGKGVLSNVPREGYTKRLISSHYLSYAETLINRAKNWDIHQKLMEVSKFITLDNKTAYKDAEIFLVFRDKALDYIRDYVSQNKEKVSLFLGAELSKFAFETSTPDQQKEGESKIIKESQLDNRSKGNKPKCEVRGGVGYITFGNKDSKPFKKLKGRQWKLAKQLVEFFGLAKTNETIYESIKLPTDSTRYPELLGDPYRKASRIHSIIENTIGDIQRNFASSSLAGLFSIHHETKEVWIDFSQ